MQVGQHTAVSLAWHARNLHTLDLSWCRNLSEKELGLIVDSCFSLKLLKLFGCSQVFHLTHLKGISGDEFFVVMEKYIKTSKILNVAYFCR